MEDFFEHRLKRRPGLILGPDESLQAVLICISETIDAMYSRESLPSVLRDVRPRVHAVTRQRLLRAFMLYGYFDALAGANLIDKYFLLRGRMENRHEIIEELLPRYGEHSPFAHSLDSVGFSLIPPMIADISKELEIEKLAPTIIKSLRRAGYSVDLKNERPTDRLRYSNEAFKVEVIEELRAVGRMAAIGGHSIIYPYLNTLVLACLAMFQRTIALGCPLFSATAAGPSWISNSPDRTTRILKVVWDEVGWLPRPETFSEARSMLEDDRIESLRGDIFLWAHKIAIGDLHSEQDLRVAIQSKLKWFKSKSWASQVTRFITYAAVPISIAELILGQGAVGLTVTGLGATAQFIDGQLQRMKRKHWLSLGMDYLGDK